MKKEKYIMENQKFIPEGWNKDFSRSNKRNAKECNPNRKYITRNCRKV